MQTILCHHNSGSSSL